MAEKKQIKVNGWTLNEGEVNQITVGSIIYVNEPGKPTIGEHNGFPYTMVKVDNDPWYSRKLWQQ